MLSYTWAVLHAALILLALTLFALLVWARRGRRVDDHPVCRKCRYDLSGTSTVPARCSECGTDLTRQRAVRTGNREPRRRTALIAGTLLLPAIALVGLDAYVTLRGIDTIRHQPAWWLLRKAKSGDTALPAVEELLRRHTAGELSAGHTDDLVAALVDVHADPTGPWPNPWAHFVEPRLRIAPKELRDRYWTNAVRVDLFAHFRPGGDDRSAEEVQHLLILARGGQPRYGGDGIHAKWVATRLTVDGADLDPSALSGALTDFANWSARGNQEECRVALVRRADRPADLRALAVEATFDLTAGPTISTRGGITFPADVAAATGHGRVTLRTHALVPQNLVPIILTLDRALEPALRTAIGVEDLTVTSETGRTSTRLKFKLVCRDAPADLAYTATFALPDESRTWQLRTEREPVRLVCARGKSAAVDVDVPLYGFTGNSAEMRLIPDPIHAARAGFGTTPGFPLRFPDLPVTWRPIR